MLTVILLICSTVATPDPRDCIIDNSLRHEVIGQTDNVMQCAMAGMFAGAEHRLKAGLEYPKIMRARPIVGVQGQGRG